MALWIYYARKVSLQPVLISTKNKDQKEAEKKLEENQYILLPEDKSDILIMDHNFPIRGCVRLPESKFYDVSDRFEYVGKWWEAINSNEQGINQMWFEFAEINQNNIFAEVDTTRKTEELKNIEDAENQFKEYQEKLNKIATGKPKSKKPSKKKTVAKKKSKTKVKSP